MFNYDHPNDNKDKQSYSWKGLSRAASGVFIFMAAIFVYLGCTAHGEWYGRLFLFLFAVYLVAMLFYINRSKKHLMRGLTINAIIFIAFWLWMTYGGRQWPPAA